LLSGKGVSDARPLIEGLAKDATGPDKEAFEKSLERLKAK
jgi:hypothetical protein